MDDPNNQFTYDQVEKERGRLARQACRTGAK